ncbi:MAG: YraN family protein [Verrucomicrobia bacterium]|nr:YraN family protein [Verrucomicrobiota bacterium]
MTIQRKDLGARGERAALRHLRDKGFRLRARNWRSAHGEIDIVMQHGEIIVFVEVRSRSSRPEEPPMAMLSATKQHHMLRTAQDYMYRYRMLDRPWRIDCVFVTFDGARPVSFEHVENAV